MQTNVQEAVPTARTFATSVSCSFNRVSDALDGRGPSVDNDMGTARSRRRNSASLDKRLSELRNCSSSADESCSWSSPIATSSMTPCKILEVHRHQLASRHRTLWMSMPRRTQLRKISSGGVEANAFAVHHRDLPPSPLRVHRQPVGRDALDAQRLPPWGVGLKRLALLGGDTCTLKRCTALNDASLNIAQLAKSSG